jgi:putative glutamine amidotransferase
LRRPWVAVASTRLAAGRVTGWTDSAEAVPSEYLAALRRAGLSPATIGPDPRPDAAGVGAEGGAAGRDGAAGASGAMGGGVDELLGPWAGLVLCGGPDVDPARYGEEPHPAVYGVDPGRDAFEVGLVLAAQARRLPVLGICRGIQVINVAWGGTLLQHVPDRAGAVPHGVPAGAGIRVTHPVDVVAGSRLSAALGHATRIESCVSVHHQAVARLAEGLVVTARSADGLIEAAEPADPSAWCVAVQWHPERSAAVDPAQQAIFDGFADAARAQVASW